MIKVDTTRPWSSKELDVRHGLPLGVTNEDSLPEIAALCREQRIGSCVGLASPNANKDTAMDKDRIKGSADQAKGAVKEGAGKMFGDKKLENEGNADKAAGKVENAVGGLKDAVRGK